MTGEVRGWLFWQGDEPRDTSPQPEWHSLLIGYDMMPLRGLRQTEALLREKHGWEACPTAVRIVEPGQEHCLGPALNGAPCLNALHFSSWTRRDERAWMSLAHWLVANYETATLHPDTTPCESTIGSMWRSLVPDVANFTTDDSYALRYFAFLFRRKNDPTRAEDGRRQRTLDRQRERAMALMRRVGLELVPLRFERLAPDALPKDDEEWERERTKRKAAVTA